jgi:beta-lactam-binding protein with PASTA domain/predicted Ser/Thr protein kinase
VSKLLGGRYDLQEQIGDGGMAVVYRAIDTLLGRQVAVKMLRSEFAGDDEFVGRFRREAQSAASLSHPNIVNLYDVGMSANDEYYIVMEYVDGPTLKEVIRERGPLPVKEVVSITEQICDALEHAHDRHIVHRDIKPHNILLTKSGQVKVTDFGIARAITGNTITHHDSSSVLGSVHYFSPEQARGAAADVKSDIYSLGVVMYEMLTHRLPFSGDSPVGIALKHLRDHFVEPKEINPEMPQSIENIVLRCLVKDPDARYQDMRAVKSDVKEALVHPDVPKFVMPQEVPEETLAIPVVGNRRGSLEGNDVMAKDRRAKKQGKWWMWMVWSGVAVIILGIGAVAAYYIFMNLMQVPNRNLPNVKGDSEQQAMTTLQSAGFSRSQIVEKRATNAKPAGTVYEQDPQGGSEVKATRTVVLWISNGPQKMQMPDLSGIPVSEAEQELVNMGIPTKNVTTKTVKSANYSDGLVVSTIPAANASVTVDSKITLDYSSGVANTTVPDIRGLSLQDAKVALQQAHLQVGQISKMPYPGQDGSVFRITPYTVGETVPEGTAINLFVIDNSGESGGGLGSINGTDSGTSNGTTNTTGVSQGTVMKTVDVKVRDTSGQPIHVQIYKTDETGTRLKQVDETITTTTSWTIQTYVSSQQPGDILVYENGVYQKDYPVTAQ